MSDEESTPELTPEEQQAEIEAKRLEEEALARKETPDVDDGRIKQIGETIGDKEVVAVRYTEENGERSSFEYILDDDTVVPENKLSE